MLEELSGTSKLSFPLHKSSLIDPGLVFHDVLSKCIPKLPNLQHLNVFKGEALERTGNLFRLHCPLFRSVKFYGWYEL